MVSTIPPCTADMIVAHIKEKWANIPCCMCKGNDWNVSDTQYQLTEIEKRPGEGYVIPTFPVICTNCGNTMLISSVVVLKQLDIINIKEPTNG